MNVFKRELKANSKALIVWTICSLLLTYVSYWEYGLTDPQELSDIFIGFPDIINTLFGLSPLGISDVMGYSALIIYYIYFIGLAYALILGSKILQKELDDQTSEFLFTKPITRTAVLFEKTAVAKIYMAIFSLANFGLTSIMMIRVDDAVYSDSEIIKYMFLAYLGLYILMLVTYMITLAANCFFENKMMSLIIGGMFITYAYASSIIILSFEKFNDLTILSPWRYFSVDILVNNGFNFLYLLICIVIIAIAWLVAYKSIKRKMF